MRRKWHYWTNGIDNEIAVFENETPPEGYFLGRKPISAETRQKQRLSAIKRGSNNKGKKFSDTARKNMSDSKKKFFANNPEWKSPTAWKKGRTPWNKGVPMSDETKNKLSKSKLGTHLSDESRKLKNEHEYETKKRNNSFHTSKIENSLCNVLYGWFGENNVIHSYREHRYPFNCDFYIIPLDLFIELNYTWTHGGHPFDELNLNDSSKLKGWQEKAKYSTYYKQAIKVWTESDPLKIETARNNNLNYITIYNKEDLHDFIRGIQAKYKNKR